MKDNAIFISYRRKDTQATASRLNNSLAKNFGRDAIFKDVEDIPYGSDFRKIIGKELLNCQVVLVLIGDRYASLKNKNGNLRLMDDGDYVNIEVSTALAFRNEKLVIPVLIDGAPMPTKEELPQSMHNLTYLNGFSLLSKDWDTDYDKLKNAITKHLQPQKVKPTRQKNSRTPASPHPKKNNTLGIILGIGFGALVMLALISYLVNNNTDEFQPAAQTLSVLNFSGFVTSSQLNLRDNPGTEQTAVIGSLSKGEEVNVMDSRTVDGRIWYFVDYLGTNGWVSSKFISKNNIVDNDQPARPTSSLVTSPSSSTTYSPKARTYYEMIHGTWELTSMNSNGEKISMKELFQLFDSDGNTQIFYIFDATNSAISVLLGNELFYSDTFYLSNKNLITTETSYQITQLNNHHLKLMEVTMDFYGNEQAVTYFFKKK